MGCGRNGVELVLAVLPGLARNTCKVVANINNSSVQKGNLCEPPSNKARLDSTVVVTPFFPLGEVHH